MSDEEDVTAQLLRIAGAPQDPPAEGTARVRAAVHREWRVGRQRRLIRNGVTIVLIAVAASLMVAVWMRPVEAPRGVVSIATAERAQGRPLLLRASQANTAVPLSSSTPIYVGDTIETDASSRVGLLFSDGSSIRIDRGSRVRLLTPVKLEILEGAAYVATADTSRGLEIQTALGTLRDVGTQFEARLTGTLLRLRVRTGTVEIRRDTGVDTAAAGTETTVTMSGIAVRPVPVYGADWAWTTEVAPSFAIEGRTLGSYLQHLAGEQGWTIRYAEAGVAEAANRTILHGSIEGLSADDALVVVLSTSGLESGVRNGELHVSRSTMSR